MFQDKLTKAELEEYERLLVFHQHETFQKLKKTLSMLEASLQKTVLESVLGENPDVDARKFAAEILTASLSKILSSYSSNRGVVVSL